MITNSNEPYSMFEQRKNNSYVFNDILSDEVIYVKNLSKVFHIYNRPQDRLKQFIVPRLLPIKSLKPKRYYKEFWAIKDITFRIKKGKSIGIIGINGSGKSTLLQLICGILSPSSGSVVTKGRIAALLELGSGFNPEFSGIDNVILNASILGMSKDDIDKRIDRIIEFADIGDFINRPLKLYSSGMVVRLAFAVIAHIDADILVIDEALSVGDAFFVQKCMRFLRRFMETGTVLFVSHDTGAILNLCDEAIWIHNGSIQANGNPKEIVGKYLETIYEESQGKSIPKEQTGKDFQHKDTEIQHDMRMEFINTSKFRNDIEIFNFKEKASFFGKGGAKVRSVELMDSFGKKLSWVVGGENVILAIHCTALQKIINPIIGFQVQDRLGQVVFCDNTFLTYSEKENVADKSRNLTAYFHFRMPILPIGEYTISPAIAEGTQNEHVQHDWMFDALAFKVHASRVCLGLVGIPMEKIEIVVW